MIERWRERHTKFQVRVSAFNFTANHQTFTISRIISQGDRLPHPEFVDNLSLIQFQFPNHVLYNNSIYIGLTFVGLDRGVTMTMEMITSVAVQRM